MADIEPLAAQPIVDANGKPTQAFRWLVQRMIEEINNETLSEIAEVDPSEDESIYWSADDEVSVYTLTAFARTILDDADAGAVRATIGAVGLTGDEPIAGVKTFTEGPTISSGSAWLTLQETDAAADNGRWRLQANNEQFSLRALNDNSGLSAAAFVVDRTGITIDTVNFPNGTLQSGGVAVVTVSGTQTLTNKTLTAAQLGGDLDAQGNNITDLADVTFKTGGVGGTLRTGTSAADKFELQAYDVNGGFYQKVLEVDSGNEPQLEVFADSFAIWDNADETKRLNFTLSGGATGVTTTVHHSPTADRDITFPDATDTLVGRATTDTLTNKTLTSPVINSPTGIVKGDVGLGNVTNAAQVTLTGDQSISGRKTFAGFFNLGAGATLTIASGAVTVTGSRHTLDTEAAAATDDLDTINGGATDDILVLSQASNARDITIKHATGNITTPGATDLTLGSVNDKVMLIKRGTTWNVISSSV